MKQRGCLSPSLLTLTVFLHPAPFTAMSLPDAFTLRGKDCVVHSPALTDSGRVLLSK